MEVWGQMGLGFEGKGGRSGFRVRRGVRGRHGTRGWPARGARMAGGGGDVWRTEAEQGGGDGEDDRWARAWKIKKTSLKFETKVFSG